MPKDGFRRSNTATLPGGWRLNAKGNIRRRDLHERVTAFLCSYPKSGRTWLRFMLCNYINMALKLGLELDLNSMFRILPNDSLKDSPAAARAFAFLNDRRVPFVLGTHREYRARALGGRPVILLLRSPNDVLWSSYCERVNKGIFDPQSLPLSKFLMEGDRSLYGYCRYINGWAAKLSAHRSIVVTYNQLKRDAPEALARLVTFIGLPVIPDHVRAAVELSSLPRMKALEQSSGVKFTIGPSARIRTGQIGDHARSFSAEDLALADNIYRRELNNQAKNLLREHDLLNV